MDQIRTWRGESLDMANPNYGIASIFVSVLGCDNSDRRVIYAKDNAIVFTYDRVTLAAERLPGAYGRDFG